MGVIILIVLFFSILILTDNKKKKKKEDEYRRYIKQKRKDDIKRILTNLNYRSNLVFMEVEEYYVDWKKQIEIDIFNILKEDFCNIENNNPKYLYSCFDTLDNKREYLNIKYILDKYAEIITFNNQFYYKFIISDLINNEHYSTLKINKNCFDENKKIIVENIEYKEALLEILHIIGRLNYYLETNRIVDKNRRSFGFTYIIDNTEECFTLKNNDIRNLLSGLKISISTILKSKIDRYMYDVNYTFGINSNFFEIYNSTYEELDFCFIKKYDFKRLYGINVYRPSDNKKMILEIINGVCLLANIDDFLQLNKLEIFKDICCFYNLNNIIRIYDYNSNQIIEKVRTINRNYVAEIENKGLSNTTQTKFEWNINNYQIIDDYRYKDNGIFDIKFRMKPKDLEYKWKFINCDIRNPKFIEEIKEVYSIIYKDYPYLMESIKEKRAELFKK
ncbi:MAG: hypothetical protein VB011_07845 [Bacteroidales bacterium]|nr:hypothetical protein [Bacteroidales bacterium]